MCPDRVGAGLLELYLVAKQRFVLPQILLSYLVCVERVPAEMLGGLRLRVRIADESVDLFGGVVHLAVG